MKYIFIDKDGNHYYFTNIRQICNHLNRCSSTIRYYLNGAYCNQGTLMKISDYDHFELIKDNIFNENKYENKEDDICNDKICLTLNGGERIACIKNNNNDLIGLYTKKKSQKHKKSHKKSECKKHINLSCDVFQLPRLNKREIIFIAGPSECGKTTYCIEYIKKFQKMVKHNKIILFTQTDDVELYKKNNIKYKIFDISLFENMKNIHFVDFKNCLLIFDDVDAITNKKMRSNIHNFIEKICKNGRKLNIYIIFTLHQLTDYKNTRYYLFEANKIILFLDSGSENQFKNLFKQYLGLDDSILQKLKNLDSHWVCINKKYPKYCIYENGVMLL